VDTVGTHPRAPQRQFPVPAQQQGQRSPAYPPPASLAPNTTPPRRKTMRVGGACELLYVTSRTRAPATKLAAAVLPPAAAVSPTQSPTARGL
jgi:hypothetical protein